MSLTRLDSGLAWHVGVGRIPADGRETEPATRVPDARGVGKLSRRDWHDGRRERWFPYRDRSRPAPRAPIVQVRYRVQSLPIPHTRRNPVRIVRERDHDGLESARSLPGRLLPRRRHRCRRFPHGSCLARRAGANGNDGAGSSVEPAPSSRNDSSPVYLFGCGVIRK